MIMYIWNTLKAYWKLSENKKKLKALTFVGVVFPLLIYTALFFANELFVKKGWILFNNEHFGFPKFWEFLAVYLGVCALFIGLIVILKLVGDVANNSEEFLPIFKEILEQSSPNDEVVIIAPTFMIEKKRFPKGYDEYKNLLISKASKSVKVQFCFLQTQLFTKYNLIDDVANKDSFINKNQSTDPLIEFHLNFISKDFQATEGVSERITFFDELFSFYTQLHTAATFSYTPLKKEYDVNKFIAIANKTKGIYFIGAYEIKEHKTLKNIFDYSASKFKYDATNSTFNQLLQQTINQFKV